MTALNPSITSPNQEHLSVNIYQSSSATPALLARVFQRTGTMQFQS